MHGQFEMPFDWARALVDERAFRDEQARLAHRWTFLGLASDVEKDGDWFRTTLATRPVFVQRFGDDLKAFENRCVHRHFPLRLKDSGNGPIVCQFHHWRYNRDGQALGIAACPTTFGATPREMDARLVPVELARCGNYLFGRFPGIHPGGSLEEELGQTFGVLESMSRSAEKPFLVTCEVKANWRLCVHITLDDYHLVAVHPATFGKRAGYLNRDKIRYFRMGDHSAYMSRDDDGALDDMIRGCASDTYVSSHYVIFNIFPGFSVSHTRTDAQFWCISSLHFAPIAHDRSLMRAWIHPSPFVSRNSALQERLRPVTDPFRKRIVRRFFARILDEDRVACERQQQVAASVDGPPILGRLEERIGWFEETYRAAVRRP